MGKKKKARKKAYKKFKEILNIAALITSILSFLYSLIKG